mmetsp:Transcript_14465/g.29200  ORF Transcript_14465/g.29200 Transcript_14465/m.29200 type:complete len:107 (-) Transcript_14465:1097-1417(-)
MQERPGTLASFVNKVPFIDQRAVSPVKAYLAHAEGLTEIVGDEGGHWFAVIWLNNSRKGRDGARADLLRKESKDTDLGKTTIVDLGSEAGCLLLLGHVLGELERIV